MASSDVPAAEPSVTQSWLTPVPVLPRKTILPPAGRRLVFSEDLVTVVMKPLPLPGLMSASMEVPAAVPSVVHSSTPWEKSVALNSTLLPNWVKPSGSGVPKWPGKMSLTMEVPAAVPLVIQSSVPEVGV